MPFFRKNEAGKSEIQVRETIATLLIITTAVGFFTGEIQPEWFQNLVLVVVSFYFGNRTATNNQQQPIVNQPNIKINDPQIPPVPPR